jgi:tetratricopeptide (TPR) repeat protein
MGDMDKYYQALGLNPGASEEEIKEAYRDLVNVWHPDRFSNNPRLREKAEDKLKEINIAYEKLRPYSSEEARRYTTSEGKSYAGSQSPPHEPPPKSDKEEYTRSDESQGESEPPPEPPPSRPHSNKKALSENISWKPLAFFFGGLSTTIGSHIVREIGLSTPVEAGFTSGLIVIICCLIGWGIGHKIVQNINSREEPKKGKAKSAWVVTTIGILIYFFIFTFLPVQKSVEENSKGKFGPSSQAAEGGMRGAIYFGIRGVIPSLAMQLPGLLLGKLIPISPSLLVGLSTGLMFGLAEYGRVVENVGTHEETLPGSGSQTKHNPRDLFPELFEKPTREHIPPSSPPPTREITAVDWYNKGYTLISSGNQRGAVDAFNKAIELNPKYTEAYVNRGVAFGNLGDYRQAIRDLDKAIELNPAWALAYTNRGWVYSMKREYDKAIEDVNKAIAIDPKDGKAYVIRGNSFLQKGQYDGAIEESCKVIAMNPKYDRAYMLRAIAFSEKKQYDKAIEDLNKVIELNPNDLLVYGFRAAIFHKQGQYDKAIEDYSKLIANKPNDSDAYFLRAGCYDEKGQYDKAVEDLNKTISINPKSYGAYIGRGIINYKKRDYYGAIEDFNKAIDLKPDSPGAYDNRGYAYLDLGKYQPAIRDFKKALELDGKAIDAYVGLAIVSFLQKRTEEAKAYYRKAIEIEPLCKDGVEALEREKRYFFTQNHKQTIKAILRVR